MQRITLARIKVNEQIKVCASCLFCKKFMTSLYDSSMEAVHEWSIHYRKCGG